MVQAPEKPRVGYYNGNGRDFWIPDDNDRRRWYSNGNWRNRAMLAALCLGGSIVSGSATVYAYLQKDYANVASGGVFTLVAAGLGVWLAKEALDIYRWTRHK